MNNILKKRLKAFTLAEIVIAMMISGTLLALAVKVILAISFIGSQQNVKSDFNNGILRINGILNENFRNSSLIKKVSSAELMFIYDRKDPISVSFYQAGMIVKNQLTVDTVLAVYDSLKITKLDIDTSFINSISFVIENNKITYPVYFRKNYSNEQLYTFSKNAN
jgi:type II secretory pathway pseudopilin PulG